jgi:hypothetical protein
MKRLLLAMAGFAVLASAQAAPLLSALITRETQNIGNDGVTRSSVFQERIYRDANNVWIERVLPKHHQHGQHAHQKGGEEDHHHLDLAEAAQHYFIDNKKMPRLYLVLQENKTVVHLQDADVDMLGLSDCWRCVYSLIDPQSLKKMTLLKRANGISWYETKNAKNKVKIEWDDKNNMARVIDIRGLDGLSHSVVKASIQQVNITAPWTTYGKFLTKDYSDFGD